MLRQLKTDRLAQLMLAVAVIVGCFACGIWGVSILRLSTRNTTKAAAPTVLPSIPLRLTQGAAENVPAPTPAPTPTRSGIQVDRQDLVNHFDGKEYRWREETEYNGTYKLVGESQNGTGKIVMWSNPDDPEDLIELFYAFDVPFEGGGTSREDAQEMFNLVRFIFPDWDEGSQWIMSTIKEKQGETSVNGVTVSFEWEDEEATEQTINIFSIVE